MYRRGKTGQHREEDRDSDGLQGKRKQDDGGGNGGEGQDGGREDAWTGGDSGEVVTRGPETTVARLATSLDVVMSKPYDAPHSEWRGIGRELQSLLFSTILSKVGCKAYLRAFQKFQYPPQWPRIQSPTFYILIIITVRSWPGYITMSSNITLSRDCWLVSFSLSVCCNAIF